MSTESGRRWRLANPEKMRAARKRWAEANVDRERENKAERDKRYYERHKHERDKEKIAAYARDRYAVDPEKQKAASRKWKEKNRKSVNQYAIDYYWAHKTEIQKKPKPWNSPERQRERVERRPDHYREIRAKYRAENKPLYALAAQKRRAKVRGCGGSITKEELSALRLRTGDRCSNCQKRRKLTVDHIVPLAKGGKHSINNVQFLCLSCNSSKNSSDPIDFARRMGRLV